MSVRKGFLLVAAFAAQVAALDVGGRPLDREAMLAAYQNGRRAELRASLEALLGPNSLLSSSDRAECLRYISAIYGDEADERGKAASRMLQLSRLEPQRETLGLDVKPGTDSLFRAVRADYAGWRAGSDGAGELKPYEVAAKGGRRPSALVRVSGSIACVALSAAILVLAWP